MLWIQPTRSGRPVRHPIPSLFFPLFFFAFLLFSFSLTQPSDEVGAAFRVPVGLSAYRAVAGIVKSRGSQGATIEALR